VRNVFAVVCNAAFTYREFDDAARNDRGAAAALFTIPVAGRLVSVASMRKEEIFGIQEVASHFSVNLNLSHGLQSGQHDGPMRPYSE
jgi:hypothetical protein